jgi:type IV pilus assembly protein PilV
MLSQEKIMHTPAALKPAQHGVILIEVLVSILIFSVGVLAIVGLQANMIQNTAEAIYRSEASYIAQSRIGDMWADPVKTAAGGFLEANTDISALLPGATRTVTQPTPGEFTVTVTWLAPGPNQTTHNFTTTVRISGG